MGNHIIDGEFQSDKYPTCPRGKVPLSVKDATAQDLLWTYAQRRRAVDAEFADDLEAALVAAGHLPIPTAPAPDRLRAKLKEYTDHAGAIVRDCGVAGGHIEAARAEVARELLALLDAEPAVLSRHRIPPRIRASLDLYATEPGIRPGHCVSAILAGDLFSAFARADPETRDAMPAIVAYIHSQLPAASHGSEGHVERWIGGPR